MTLHLVHKNITKSYLISWKLNWILCKILLVSWKKFVAPFNVPPRTNVHSHLFNWKIDGLRLKGYHHFIYSVYIPGVPPTSNNKRIQHVTNIIKVWRVDKRLKFTINMNHETKKFKGTVVRGRRNRITNTTA